MIERHIGARRALLRDPGHLTALGLGTGLMPAAPGTWGTLLAIPVFWAMSDLPLGAYFVALAALGAIGIWVCGRTARVLNVHDDRSIVADEIVGYLVAMTAMPFTWVTVCTGFVLFRFFDIIKPWPIGPLDRRMPGGLGIVIDDVAAGVYTAIVMHLGIRAWG
ncbi:MAG: phosphatidylglycerophosphatase A [Gammaproteobacteria bacterium]|nr:phosphatidylglycerophosphatase A [Gammaproteobacteria bacterium]